MKVSNPALTVTSPRMLETLRPHSVDVLTFVSAGSPSPVCCAVAEGRLSTAVSNLYVDKPFVQLIKHCHSAEQTKGESRSIDCTCLQRIDFLFSVLKLVEWQCFISCTKCLSTEI